MADDEDFPEEVIQSYIHLIKKMRSEQGLLGNFKMHDPVQQAHRITMGLSVAYSNGLARPDSVRVNEKAKFMAKWPKTKLLELAVSCNQEDRHGDPEYCEALALALLLANERKD